MAKAFTLEIRGMASLQKKLRQLPKQLQKEVAGEMSAAAREINSLQMRKVTVDEGGIKQGLTFKQVKPLEWDIISSKFYTPYIEFGTKSKVRVPAELTEFANQYRGPRIGNFDEFLLKIVDWVRRKGLSGRYSVKTRRRVGNKFSQLDEDFTVAYPIALSIIKKGIYPQPFFFPPFFMVRTQLIKRIEKITKDI